MDGTRPLAVAALAGALVGVTLYFYFRRQRSSPPHSPHSPDSTPDSPAAIAVAAPAGDTIVPPQVIIPATVAELDAAIELIWPAAARDASLVLGIDCEWRPTTRESPIARPVAVVQLATERIALVIPILRICTEAGGAVPPSLRALLESPRVIKAGVGVGGDVRKLRAHYHVTVCSALELQALAAAAHGRDASGLSLARMCDLFLGRSLAKDRSVQLSDWEAWPLSARQVAYAAADAYAGALLFAALAPAGLPVVDGLLDAHHHAKRCAPRKQRPARRQRRTAAAAAAADATDAFEPDLERELEPDSDSTGSGDGDGGASRPARNPFGARARPLYENCRIEGPDGTVLCSVAQRKIDWYLSRDLAVRVADDPPTIRLRFAPKGAGHAGDPFYLGVKVNRCVVCSSENELARYHVVPLSYRRAFPDALKTHSSHDVVLLCGACMLRATLRADEQKAVIAHETGVPLEGLGPRYVPYEDGIRVFGAARALMRAETDDTPLPAERVATLRQTVSQHFGGVPVTPEVLAAALRVKKRTENPDHRPHGPEVVRLLVAAAGPRPDDAVAALRAFERRWRVHFVDANGPRFLPEHWSVDGRHWQRAADADSPDQASEDRA